MEHYNTFHPYSSSSSILYSKDPTVETPPAGIKPHRKSLSIPQPTTVKTRMRPVRESFGSVTQRSCYKMELYVVPGPIPGYYLSPETRNMFLTFSKHCGTNGYSTEETLLPTGNSTYTLEKNVYENCNFERYSGEELISSQSAAAQSAGGPAGESWFVDNESDESGCCSDEGTIIWVPEKFNVSANVPRSLLIRPLNKDYNTQTSPSSSSSPTSLKTPFNMSEDINNSTKVVGQSSSESTSLQAFQSTSGGRVMMAVEKGLAVANIDPSSFGTLLVNENVDLDTRREPSTSTTWDSAPHDKDTKHLYNTTRHLSKILQHNIRPLIPAELATLKLEAMVIEDNARPKPPRSRNSSNLGTSFGSDSGSSTSIHTTHSAAISAPIAERNIISSGFLSVEMDLRLRRARADVDSLRETEQLQASRSKTLSHSSLRAERAEIAQSQVSTSSLNSTTPTVDHFQEYMTHFDLDNVTNPPAKGFLESDDSSGEDDNASIGTVIPPNPIKPQVERMPRTRRVKKEKTVKKYIFYVPDNFEELLAQAPTSPPTRPLPPVPTAPQAPTQIPKGPLPLLPRVALTQPAEVKESTPKIEALKKEYTDYLNNINRDESTRVKCKNKTEHKPGLEADLEAFMESEAQAAGWMKAKRKI
ncbi:hypothetical protein P167DRAFT_576729 [Morchella conica CCBAS932]|uniref:Uncharacterized protein n=1 Tax=Morchella conica CCBAS932 TaxID=1392247 RepID=A0A3N4KH31_9PEZI|nr:hypothetical protein P167DRAFT_576729 [Morchella conica CCBAS932]